MTDPELASLERRLRQTARDLSLQLCEDDDTVDMLMDAAEAIKALASLRSERTQQEALQREVNGLIEAAFNADAELTVLRTQVQGLIQTWEEHAEHERREAADRLRSNVVAPANLSYHTAVARRRGWLHCAKALESVLSEGRGIRTTEEPQKS